MDLEANKPLKQTTRKASVLDRRTSGVSSIYGEFIRSMDTYNESIQNSSLNRRSQLNSDLKSERIMR